MKVEEMEFTFSYKNRSIKATCSKFKPKNKVHYRVAFGDTIEDEEVYNFYQDKKEERLWWHELPDQRQEKAKVIASALELIIFSPN
jgi:hypothetical protein